MAYERNLDAIFRPPICSSPGQRRNPSAHNAAIEFLNGAAIKIYSYLELMCAPRIQDRMLFCITFTAWQGKTKKHKRKVVFLLQRLIHGISDSRLHYFSTKSLFNQTTKLFGRFIRKDRAEPKMMTLRELENVLGRRSDLVFFFNWPNNGAGSSFSSITQLQFPNTNENEIRQ